ncbi:MAG: EamA family transporter [Firmicutes bacterium]|nr:EamA family transporter [Bacillota bacterium]
MLKKIPGPVLMILASIFFALGGLLIKSVPWSGMAVNGMRCFISMWVIAAYMKITKNRFRVNRTVLIGALCMAVTTLLYSLSNKLTTAGNCIVLQFTSPVFVMLYSLWLFKRKPLKADIIACVFVFAGVIIFFIDSLSAGNMLGNFLAIVAGATFAGVYLMNEGEGAHPVSSVLLANMINSVVGLPWILKTDLASTPVSGWISIFGLGIFQMAVAYIFFTESIKKTRPVTASLLSVIEVILNPLLVAIFMNEKLTALSLVGAVIITVSITVYNVILARQSLDKKNREAV